MNISIATRILILFSVFVLTGTLAPSSRAQSTAVPESTAMAFSAWHATIGTQYACALQSRNEAVREIAMQNIIALASLHPGAFDFAPAVPRLLDIYANDRDEQYQIMAVAALRAIGHRPGMEELYRLTEEKPRWSKAYKLADYAVKHYYVTQEVDRHQKLADYYAAKGNVKKADRHARRAAAYRSRIS